MELKYADITEKIIGCAMKVHSKMGPGFPEIIYSRCLAIEFGKIGLRYEKERNLDVCYDDVVVGGRKVDFLVEEKIIVELKALAAFADKDFVQTLNYLESHQQEIALLLNFGASSLQFKRIINNKNLSKPSKPDHLLSEPGEDYNPANPLKNAGHLSSNNIQYPWSNPDNPWSNNPDNPWS